MTTIPTTSPPDLLQLHRPVEQNFYRYLPFFGANRRPIHFILFCYFLLVPTGNMLRFFNEGRSGISTILLAIILLLNLTLGLVVLHQENLYKVLVGYGLWSLALTLFAGISEPAILVSPLGYLIYVMLSASVAYFSFYAPSTYIRKYYSVAAISALVFGCLTFIDFFGFVELGIADVVLRRVGAEEVLTSQLEGAFNSRTAYGGIMAVLAPGWFILMMETKNRRYSFLYGLAAVITTMLLLYTHHRMILLIMVAVLAIYGLSHIKKNRWRWALLIVLVFGLSWFITQESSIALALKIKFQEAFVSDSVQGRSDLVRLELLRFSLENLWQNPVGNGWTELPYEQSATKGAHSVVTQFIWSAGVIGILALALVAVIALKTFGPIYRGGSDAQKRDVRPMIYSIIGWFIFTTGHQGISIGMAWVVLGLLIGQLRQQAATRNRASVGDVVLDHQSA